MAVVAVSMTNPSQVFAKETGKSVITATNTKNENGVAVGAKETAYVYNEPSHGARAVNVVLKNQIIRVLGEVGGFYKLQYGSSYGYIDKTLFLEGEELLQYVTENDSWFTRSVSITETSTNLYSYLTYQNAGTALFGETFQLKGEVGEFYIVIPQYFDVQDEHKSAFVYVRKDACKVKCQVSVTSFESSSVATTEQMDLVEFACQFVGNPYVWGGNDPYTGADCSGFVRYVYKHFGVDLPRCSYDQAEVGTTVSFDEMQPGDLIFYYRGNRIGHVAMYIGNGKAVHARGHAYGICITDYDYSTPAWAKRVW